MNRRQFLRGAMWGSGAAAVVGAQIAIIKYRASRPKMEASAEAILGAPEHDVRTVAFSLAGDQLVSVSADRKISVWDPAAEKIVLERLSPVRGGGASVSLFGNGSWLAVIDDDTFLSIWKSGAEGDPQLLRLDSPPKAVAFCPKMIGPFRACVVVAVAMEDHSVRIFERDANGSGSISTSSCCGGRISSGHGEFVPTQALRPNFGGAVSLSFSHNADFLAVGGHETVQLWVARNWVRHQVLAGHKGRIGGVAFSSDDRFLAAGADDGSIIVWDWRQSAQIAALKGSDHTVTSLAFFGGDDWIIAGYADGAIRIWPRRNSTDGLAVAKSPGRHTSIAASKDGQYLAASWGDTVRFWKASHFEADARRHFG